MTTTITLPPLAWPYTGLATNIKEMIRARDEEVARLVLKAVKDACAPSGPWHHYETASECRGKIDRLEVKHHE
jgi:hypothetical protein